MFFRVFREGGQREVIYNVNMISMIEVEYGLPSQSGSFFKTTAREGVTNSDAQRYYRVHVAGDELLLVADPDDAVTKIFDEIYRNAVKGGSPQMPSDSSE